MPEYLIDVYDNVTYDITGRPAVLGRPAAPGLSRPGDSLRYAWSLPVDLPDSVEAFDLVLHAAACLHTGCPRCPLRLPARRGPIGFGDLVVVTTADLTTVTADVAAVVASRVCEPSGWLDVDPADYRLVIPEATCYLVHDGGRVTGPYTRAQLRTMLADFRGHGPTRRLRIDLGAALTLAARALACAAPGGEVVMVWPLDPTWHALRHAHPRS